MSDPWTPLIAAVAAFVLMGAAIITAIRCRRTVLRITYHVLSRLASIGSPAR